MSGYAVWLWAISLGILNIFANSLLQKSALPQTRKQFITIGIGLVFGIILSFAFRLNFAYAVPVILVAIWLEFYTFNLISSTTKQRKTAQPPPDGNTD